MAIAAAAILCMAIVTPHLMRLQSAAPATAALVWLLAIALRALVAVGGGLALLFYLPRTALFKAVADWCLHEILPTFAAHLGLSAHPVVHVAVAIQGAALTVSLSWLIFGSARAWIGLRKTLSDASDEGPWGSTVVADEDILVAVPTVGRPRILISHTALKAFDGDELRASLEHERGHLERRHRPVMLAATLLSAVARPLPGTRAAHRQLIFSLERDADEYAVGKTDNPLALASAICKALGAVPRPVGAALTGRGQASARLTYLLEREQAPRCTRPEYAARGLAVLLAALVMLLAASLPAWAASDSPAQLPPSACAR